VFTLLPLLTDDFGQSGSWCWIKRSNVSLFWRFFEFYIPLWWAIVYNAYTYYKVIQFLKQEMQENVDDRLIKRFMLYPLILVFCWMFATINRINTLFFKESLTLNILHRLFGSLQGILNAIIYGMNQNVRREIKIYMRQHWLFKRCIKSNPNEELDNGVDSPFGVQSHNERLLKLARMSSADIELQLKKLNSD